MVRESMEYPEMSRSSTPAEKSPASPPIICMTSRNFIFYLYRISDACTGGCLCPPLQGDYHNCLQGRPQRVARTGYEKTLSILSVGTLAFFSKRRQTQAFLHRFARRFAVVKMNRPVFQDLIILVTFARDNHHIAVPRFINCLKNRFPA